MNKSLGYPSSNNSMSPREVLDIIYNNILESPGKFNSAVRRALSEGLLDQSLMDRLNDISNLDEVITDRITHIIDSKNFAVELDEEIDEAIRNKVVNLVDSDNGDELLQNVAIIIINSKGFQDMIIDNYCDRVSEATNKLLYNLVSKDEEMSKDVEEMKDHIDVITDEIAQLNFKADELQLEHNKIRDRLVTFSNDITVNDLGIELTNQEILRIDNRISELKEELQRSQQKIDNLLNVLHENNGDISIIDTKMESMDERIARVEDKCDTMNSSVDEYQTNVDKLEHKLRFMDHHVIQQSFGIDDNTRSIQEMREDVESDIDKVKREVANIKEEHIMDQSDTYDMLEDIYKQLDQLKDKAKENDIRELQNKEEQIMDQNDIYDMIDDIYKRLEQLHVKDEDKEARISINEKYTEYTFNTVSNLAADVEDRNKKIMDMFDSYAINLQTVSDYVYSIYQYIKDFLGLRTVEARLNEIMIVIFAAILLIAV